MGVRTTADEHLDECAEHVAIAMRHLNEVVFGECWGSDEYGKEYADKLTAGLLKLKEIKSDLAR